MIFAVFHERIDILVTWVTIWLVFNIVTVYMTIISFDVNSAQVDFI